MILIYIVDICIFFFQLCYICEEKNKGHKATYGACMPCNKSGCKLVFHVTCAQSAGLLCEEAGNYYDNVKYVGYCKHHYSKLVCILLYTYIFA